MFTLGGTIKGYSPQQTITNYKSSEQVMTRRILRDSWNTAYATGSYNNNARIITPFRAVNNSGDFLSRKDYICGGSNQVSSKGRAGTRGPIGSIISACDTSGVPSSSCNVKFVADSSDYTTFRKQQTSNRNYNDSSNGGDQSNASYVAIKAVRRF
jgi:hypothetical protein